MKQAGNQHPSEASELVVFDIVRESKCAECGREMAKGDFLFLERERPLCLSCADLDHLTYLPRGDTALTRRARKHSALSAVVVRFSSARRRYERQGTLVEEAALDRAAEECHSDAAERMAVRERAQLRRAQQDRDLMARMAEAILKLFPGCPPGEARAIAKHTAVRGSGRVGRTAAGQALEEEALVAAVIAAIRHQYTSYDQLLMGGYERAEARQAIREELDRVLERWRCPAAGQNS